MIRYKWEISVWLIVLLIFVLVILSAAFGENEGLEEVEYCGGNLTWLDREFCGISP